MDVDSAFHLPIPQPHSGLALSFLDSRLTERRNPRTASIDLATAAEIVDLMNAEDRSVPEAVATQRAEIARAIDLAEGAFRADGRLFYIGAGTSGRLGVLDASECPPTFGTDPEMVQGIIAGGLPALTKSQEGAEDVVSDGASAMDEREVGSNDFVIGIAASGTTFYNGREGALRTITFNLGSDGKAISITLKAPGGERTLKRLP